MKKCRIILATLLFFVVSIITGCKEVDDNKNNNNEINDESQEELNNYNNFYFVYYENYSKKEIYFGSDEESFEAKYKLSRYHDWCDGVASSDDFYGCFDRSRKGYRFSNTILDFNTGDVLEFDQNDEIVYLAEKEEFRSIDPRDYREIFEQKNIYDYELDDFDKQKGEYLLFRDDHNKYYHFNVTSNEIITLPEGYNYISANSELTKFVGNDGLRFIKLDIKDPNNYKLFDKRYNIQSIRCIKDNYLLFNDKNYLYLLNVKDETIIRISEYEERVWDVNVIDNLITYTYNDTLFIYNIDTNKVVNSFNDVIEVYTGYQSKQFILVKDHKFIWYSINGTVSETTITEEIDSYVIPIICDDILFFPSSSMGYFLVYKDTGYYGSISDDSDPIISYILGDNRIYVSYTNGDSYIITKDNIEYIDWIFEKIVN